MLTLPNILKVNAVSSGITGLLLVLFPRTIAPVMGLHGTPALYAVGVFLIVFAAIVFAVSIGKPIRQNAVKIIIALDVAWVLTSLVIVIALVSMLTVIGSTAILGVACWVGAMVFLQQRGLRQSVETGSTGKGV